MTVLTGFLGAGKTTCLNAFLGTPNAAGAAVVVNEFGAIDVDGAVLQGRVQGGGEVLRLPNGCVCCEVQEDLAGALLDLAARAEVGRCIVETTGLAEPGAILRGLYHDPRLRKAARAELVLTVCAADRVCEQIDRFPESARQIALADRIALSKTDLVLAEDAANARAAVARLNPLAEIAASGAHATLFAPLSGRRSVPDGDGHNGGHAPHPHSHGIAGFFVPLDGALDRDMFRDAMSFLILRHADNLLRAKGVVRFVGDARAHLINIVHDVHDARPTDARTASGLVFIGQGLPKAEIRTDLQACLRSVPATA